MSDMKRVCAKDKSNAIRSEHSGRFLWIARMRHGIQIGLHGYRNFVIMPHSDGR